MFMNTTLSDDLLDKFSQALKPSFETFAAVYPGETGLRQPVHVVYGGAHLFKSDTTAKLGALARKSFETYAPDAKTFAEIFGLNESAAEKIFERVTGKLAREPVEDFRIDFEDGYGIRADTEEDEHAANAALETAKAIEFASLPKFFGIRIKAFTAESHRRAIRTLDIFLTNLLDHSSRILPANFVVTLPKIVASTQVAMLADILETFESRYNLPENSLKLEIMVETTQAIFDENGAANLPKILAAARKRCTAAHFGAYDYTASCNITAADQDLLHPACDFARNMMQTAFAGTGVRLADGATNIMPIAAHRGENLTAQQEDENILTVRRAWQIHSRHVRNSLKNGFFQSWDLHPAQLIPRYAAVYSFFDENLDATAERLKNFVGKAAQATLVGEVFDDAATGQGLLNYFLRAINCGALNEQEVLSLTGLSLEELSGGSFMKILQNRQK